MAQAWEIENFLDVRDGQLHIDGVSAVDLARDHGTPLFVFSESRIRHNIARLQKAGEVIDCPLKVCYAAKAASTMAILRAVKDAGCDIEVNSGGELWKALEIGFRGDQIIFNGTSKEVWELENAINADIYAIQVDSLYELSLIEQTAKRLNKRANVSLRLVPEIESGTHSGLQTALLTSKFGMMPDEAFSAFRDYKDSPHLDLCGIHLHVGSQNPDPVAYTAALETLYAALKRIYSETGIRLKHINIGGGFPVNYLRDDSLGASFPDGQRQMFEADFNPSQAVGSAWQAIREAVGSSGDEHLFENLTLLIEPGRSIVADAGICLTTVRNVKGRPLSRNAKMLLALKHRSLTELNDLRSSDSIKSQTWVGKTSDLRNELNEIADNDSWLLTDAGFNILLSMETYKWYYHLISAERAGENHDFPYKLAGPLCDGGDVYFDIEGQNRLPDHRMLPEGIEPGEILALLNCGAYTIAQESQYNGRFLPAVVLIRENGDVELVRKREGFEDLITNDIY
ncbi:MAG: diaminopimelate decarboxylase family protein [Pyrinomonadaceae bacterium]